MTLRAKLILSAVSLAAVLGLGAYGTFSAFTGTTSNNGSSLGTGNVTISDDDGGTLPMFTVTNMVPGDSATRCINVTNSGSRPLAVVNFHGAVGGTGLDEVLDVDVDRGTGATGGNTFNCTGFSEVDANVIGSTLENFPTSGAPLADSSGWAVNATKSYRIRLSLASSVNDSYEDLTATVSLTWDAQ